MMCLVHLRGLVGRGKHRFSVRVDSNVQRFRGGLVFKAHRLLFHSTLDLRVMKKKSSPARAGVPWKVQDRFRCGPVFKAHRLCVSLNSRLEGITGGEEDRRSHCHVLCETAEEDPLLTCCLLAAGLGQRCRDSIELNPKP